MVGVVFETDAAEEEGDDACDGESARTEERAGGIERTTHLYGIREEV